MADLSLRNVKKVYDNSVVAVQDFNLEIADKEFIVLVGPFRLRQVHHAAYGGRLGGDHRG